MIERWGRLGKAELVGSVRHALVVARDIDVEVTVAALDPAASFAVVGEIASDPRTLRAVYRNQSDTHGWLYWEIGARGNDGEEWTIETYLSGPDDPYAGWSAELALVLDRVLTPSQRELIVTLKEATAGEPDYRAMDIYRAVVDGGVGTVDELGAWCTEHGSRALIRWLPGA